LHKPVPVRFFRMFKYLIQNPFISGTQPPRIRYIGAMKI